QASYQNSIAPGQISWLLAGLRPHPRMLLWIFWPPRRQPRASLARCELFTGWNPPLVHARSSHRDDALGFTRVRCSVFQLDDLLRDFSGHSDHGTASEQSRSAHARTSARDFVFDLL